MLSPADPTDKVAITVSNESNDTVVPASMAKFIHAPRFKLPFAVGDIVGENVYRPLFIEGDIEIPRTLGGMKGLVFFKALVGVGFAVSVGLAESGVRVGTVAYRIVGAVFIVGDLDGTSAAP